MKKRADRYKINDEKKNKKKKKTKKFFKILIAILLLVSLAFLGLLYYINLLPLKYYLIVCGGVGLLDLVSIILILKKGWKKRLVGTLICLILIVAAGVGIVYEANVIGLFWGAKDKGYKTQNYKVIVLNTSKYKKIDDIRDEYIGILKIEDTEGLSDAVAKINSKVKVSYKEMDDLKLLEDNLLNGNISVMMIEDSYYEIAKEENVEFKESTRVIYEFPIDIKIDGNLAKEVDITQEPFTIFISGIDTYGKISSVSRSDVNMLVTVNPNTHKVLMTSIPRDYYVYLHGITSYKDKITHAGIHGIDMSVKTAEDLLDCDINYYVKVNFTSVIDIVNEIGGIEVESPYTFTTYDGKYTFKKGYNKLNGEQALYFVRERKAFTGGDRTRNQNQQLVLTAIINKLLTKSMITKYDSILTSLDGSFVTNLDNKNLTNLIKKQIKNNYKWEIDSYYLEGSDSFNYTYSYKSAMSYVMEPDEDSLKEGIKKINAIINEGKKK